MVRPFKKLLSKLDIPKNDWVLSRFGGCEPPSNPRAANVERDPAGEEAPISQGPSSVAARLLTRWFDGAGHDEATIPPQSGARLSSNATDSDATDAEGSRGTRAS